MKKKRKNSLFSHPIFFTIIGFVFLLLISFPLAKNISKKYAVDNEIKELESEISQLESDNKDLQNFIDHLNSEEFVEEQARLNLGMKKRGEEVVILKDEEADLVSKNNSKEQKDKVELSNPQKWWCYFFQ